MQEKMPAAENVMLMVVAPNIVTEVLAVSLNLS
jgi:hypothetical protein